MQLQQGKQIPKIKFASQMWATRPHLASIFEKLLDQKTFICLRLIIKNILLHGFYEFVQFFVYDAIRCIQTAVSQFPKRL